MALSHQLSIILLIVAATLVFFQEQFTSSDIVSDYAVIPASIKAAWTELRNGNVVFASAAGTLSRLFTALFLHGDAQHLLYNMIFLWIFGSLVAGHLGQLCALACFLLTGALGNMVQVMLNPDSPIPVLGASGAICGLQGIYLGLALRWTLPWPDVWPLANPIPPLQLGAVAVIGFLFDFYSLMNHQQGIAFGAHMGGFVSGVALAAIITQVFSTMSSYERGGMRW
jgi:membrane associated rhomboid family serine protease